jgi:transcription-repair coupling factor (superfamily II helicase)
MDQIKAKIFSLPVLAEFADLVKNHSHIHLTGMAGSFRAYMLANLLEKYQKSILYIANDQDTAECLKEDVELLLGSSRTVFIPALTQQPYDHYSPNPAALGLRLEIQQKFILGESWVAISTPEGICEGFQTPEDFIDHQIFLQLKQKYSFDKLIGQLGDIGLERAEMVERVGQFSVRGGLIDLFAWNYDEPIRIEFWGEDIDSIRQFDVISQRSTGQLNEITVLPSPNRDSRQAFLDEALPGDTVIVMDDSQFVRQKIEAFFTGAEAIYQRNISDNIENLPPAEMYLTAARFDKLIAQHKVIESSLIQPPGSIAIDFRTQPAPDFTGSIKLFLQYLRNNAKKNPPHQIYLEASNQPQLERLREIIDEEEIPFHGRFIHGALHKGFQIPDAGIEILTEHEILNRIKRRQPYKKYKSGEYLRQLSSLNLYDYVVHIDYGVGQYMGMQTLEFGDVKKECVKLVYLDDDALLVTVDRLNRIQKFSAEEGGAPKLTKLGTPEWERAKQRTRESLKRVAAELIQIYAARKGQTGFTFAPDNFWQKELEASFPFEETDDQLKSIMEVKQDMESDKPMDRLLCGDVGFGKTEVALRAAFKAVMTGKQCAILVPTTILAFQHHETFSERLKEFPVRVDMINRFRSAKEQRLILEDMAAGKIDIIIGTHRLLSEDVKFKDLGLLVVDEEQRFGVKHKERLKKYRLAVDILSMTATPIPRTLHLALMGARDFSNIDTPPRNRLPVHTEIMHWNEEHIHNIIRRELNRGGQVYFVHNRIETITGVKEALAAIVPQARIAIGHGQLPERQLEKVMFDFMHKKYDVLLATMIIENGLDIPNVNTIIINRADKMGLSQLYQLRGRVGRSGEQAYAYLLIPPMEKVADIAHKRLRTIMDFTDLGSGYRIALRDLEIRGAGNLLGKEQSGFMQSVGFDMYCKILDEAVKELRKELPQDARPAEIYEQSHKITDPKIDVDFDLLIPADYISNELERITIYHRLVNFTSIDQIEKMSEELKDRFGQMPNEALCFLLTIEIKVLAGHLYARRLIIKDSNLRIFFSGEAESDDDFFKTMIPNLMNQKIATVRFLNQKDLGVEFALKGVSRAEKLAFAKKVLHQVVGNS